MILQLLGVEARSVFVCLDCITESAAGILISP